MDINASFEEDNRVKARNYSGSGASYVSDPKVKLMCSYGGKILPRPSDGKLRYAGGDTRMLSVSRYMKFSALQQKMVDVYGPHLTLKYQLPEEDLDALVTVSSDEDLENMMDECDRLALEGSSRLRVFVFSSIDADAPDINLSDPRLLEQQYVDAVNALQVDASFRRSDGSATLPPYVLPIPVFEGHHPDVAWNASQRPDNFSPVTESHNFTPFLDKEYLSGKFPPLYPNGIAPAVAVSQAAVEPQRRQNPEPSAFVPVHPPVSTVGSDFRELESGGSASSSSSSQHDPYHQASNQRWPPGLQSQPYLESMPYINGKDQLIRGNQQMADVSVTDVSAILPRKMAEKPSKIDGIRSTSPEVKKVDLDVQEGRPLSPGAILQRQLLADLNNNNSTDIHTEGLKTLMTGALRQQPSDSQRLREDLPVESSSFTTCTIQPPVLEAVVDPLGFPATSSRLSPKTGDFTNRVDSYRIETGGNETSKSNPVIYTQLDYGGNHLNRATTDSLHDIRTQVYSTNIALEEMPQVQSQVQIPVTSFPVYSTPVSSDVASQVLVPVTSFPEQKREHDYNFGQTKPSPWQSPDVASYLFPKPANTFNDEVPDLNNTPKIKDDSGSTSKITNKPMESQEERQEPISAVSRIDIPAVSLLDDIQYDNKVFAPADSDLIVDSYPHTMGVSVGIPDIPPFSQTTDLLQSDMDLSTSQVHLAESHSDENINAKVAEPSSLHENVGNGNLDPDVKPLAHQKAAQDTRHVNGEIKLTIDDEEDALPIGEPLPPNHFAVQESFVESWSTTLQSHKDQRVAVPENNQVKDLSLLAEKLSIEDTKTDIEDLDTFQSATDGTIGATFDLSHHIAVSAEEMAKNSGLQIIRYHDLEELRELGSGTFGTVYHGKWRGTDVAIKKIKSSCFTGRPSERDRLIADFWQEASLLGQLHHPNVVAFYGVVPDGPDGTLATVTEYMVNGSLKQALQKKDRLLDRRKRLLIAMDAAFGMEYLHGKNIVHFDLKCENLLVNLRDLQRPICKVGDLGLSKVKQQTMISGGVRGTLPWMAPELLNGRSSLVSEKVDVFSFGIVLWEILTGDEPYADMHYGAIIGGIVSNTLRPEIPESCDPGYKLLMEACWATDPAKRPTFSEIARKLRSMESNLSAKARAQAQTSAG